VVPYRDVVSLTSMGMLTPATTRAAAAAREVQAHVRCGVAQHVGQNDHAGTPLDTLDGIAHASADDVGAFRGRARDPFDRVTSPTTLCSVSTISAAMRPCPTTTTRRGRPCWLLHGFLHSPPRAPRSCGASRVVRPSSDRRRDDGSNARHHVPVASGRGAPPVPPSDGGPGAAERDRQITLASRSYHGSAKARKRPVRSRNSCVAGWRRT